MQEFISTMRLAFSMLAFGIPRPEGLGLTILIGGVKNN